MKNRMVMLGVLAGSLVLSPLAVSALPDDSRMGKGHEKMMADLKLTGDQKTKLKELHQQHLQEMKPFRDKMKGVRDKVKAELVKPAPSKPALDGYAVELGDLHKQMAIKRNEHLLQVKALLTPEQFSKLVDRDWKGKEGKKGWNPHHKGARTGR
ncbi:MAG: Spy/CpxP family protein refolding chaperone [Chitinispirillaceae bacterium]|nr:Spy/CpxP family protein refolding chaperone [Chitinispirillaceae bacterium]